MAEVDLRLVLDDVPAMVSYWGADLRNRMANRLYTEVWGLTPAEMHGRHAREVFGEEIYELNLPYWERALAGERQLFEREIVDADGRRRFMEASFVPRSVDGKVEGVVIFVADVTARRVTEQARAAAESRFRLAFTGSPVGKGMFDGSGNLIEVNPALCKMLGYAEQELCGRSLASLVTPDSEPEEVERIGRVFAGDPEPPSAERQLVRKDGSTIWVILSVALAADDGQALGIGQVQDISRRKEAEDELRRSRERLVEAEKIARLGSWEWDIVNNRMSWSAGLFGIHGLSTEEFDPTLEGGEQHVYPDDRQRVREALGRAVTERSALTLEYRAVRPDGHVRTLRSQAEVVVNEAGEPIRVVGIAQDVTDAKLAQEALASVSADLELRALELRRQALLPEEEAQAEVQAPLTPRQLEIIRLVAQGLTNAAIAERLVVTQGTVKWHIKQVLAKTSSSNRAEAVARVLGTAR